MAVSSNAKRVPGIYVGRVYLIHRCLPLFSHPTARAVHGSTIVLGALYGSTVSSTQGNSFFVKPIRGIADALSRLQYNPTSGEITYYTGVRRRELSEAEEDVEARLEAFEAKYEARLKALEAKVEELLAR